MVQLKNPPLPGNRKWLVAVALMIVCLVLLVVVLMGEVLEKPVRNRNIQKQIKVLEGQIAEKQENEEAQAKAEADIASAGVSQTASRIAPLETVPDEKFTGQEKKLERDTTVENKYLQERIWGFWYIVLPLFVVVGIFLYWVRKKHKSWTR